MKKLRGIFLATTGHRFFVCRPPASGINGSATRAGGGLVRAIA